MEFDHLVLALGSVPSFFNLSGIERHALTMKSLADATALHAHLIDKLEHAELEPQEQGRREILTFVVAGGGFAGVETLAEVNDFVRGAGRYYPQNSAIGHSDGADPFRRSNPAGSEPWALRIRSPEAPFARHRGSLANATGGIRRPTGPDSMIGDEISTRTMVWTAGTSPSPLLDRIDVPRLKSGKVEVDATMEVRDRPGVWALGDIAAIPDVACGSTCPPTAQHALRQGKRLARNIVARLRGRRAAAVRLHGRSACWRGSDGAPRSRRYLA